MVSSKIEDPVSVDGLVVVNVFKIVGVVNGFFVDLFATTEFGNDDKEVKLRIKSNIKSILVSDRCDNPMEMKVH
uniref:Uncharacterized protein n=1 Tax=Tetranychus urticae TaxID=32264 RepID=T1KSA3_TETUR